MPVIRAGGPRGTRQFLAFFLAVSLLPLVLLAAGAVVATQQNARDEVNSELRASSSAGAAFVDQQLGGLSDVLNTFAKRPNLIAALGNGSVATYDNAEVSSILDEVRQARGDIAYAFMADPAGILRDLSPFNSAVVDTDFSFRDWYLGASATTRPYISVAYRSAVGIEPLVIAAAVRVLSPSGATLGILAATYTLATVRSYVVEVGRASRVALLVTDQAGGVVADASGAPLDLRSLAGDPRVRAALAGRSGTSDANVSNTPTMSAYAPVTGTHWAVIASVRSTEAIEAATRISALILGLAAVVGLAVLGAVVLLFRVLRSAEVAVAARRAAEDRFRAVFDSSGLGICTVSLSGELFEVNPTLERMLGFAPGTLATHNFADVTHLDDLEPTRHIYRRLNAGEAQSLSLEKRYLTSEGKVFWGNMTVSAVRNAGGEVEYFVAIVEDIDARRQASELLEKLNRDKSHFVSLVSHEFRTALTGIQGFSEMLRDDEELSRAEVRDYANDINSDAQRLARMINELLDLERMESGKTTLARSSVDLANLARAAVARAQTSSSIHQFTLIEDPLLRPVDGDADKLTQVLSNLLSNAVKYSPEGGQVTVTIAAAPDAAEVTVADAGLGIPPEHIERIFERYARIESANTRYIAGTGLGLPIVKQIVEMHGGTVSVSSQPGTGSTFKFTIPWAT